MNPHHGNQPAAPGPGPVVLHVAGRWAFRALLEIVVAIALLIAFVSSGPPRAQSILLCLVVLPLLTFTRKMLILDPSLRIARRASILPWFKNVQVPFHLLRPWVSVGHEVHQWRNRDCAGGREVALHGRRPAWRGLPRCDARPGRAARATSERHPP